MNNSILEKLKEKGITVSALATQLGVGRSAIYKSINGDGSRMIRVVIAKRLEVLPSELWAWDCMKRKIDDALFNDPDFFKQLGYWIKP